jgi:RimJ/RimL family protein N-acetyltransferase
MISIKPLTEEHIQTVRLWRNQDDVRKYFTESKEITEQQQIKWYEEYKQDDKDHCFIAYEDDTPIGFSCVYIDTDWCIAEFGRLMIGEKSARGKGYGIDITRLTCEYAFNKDVQLIYLEVLKDNARAIKTYEAVGFKDTGEIVYDHIMMALDRKTWIKNQKD